MNNITIFVGLDTAKTFSVEVSGSIPLGSTKNTLQISDLEARHDAGFFVTIEYGP